LTALEIVQNSGVFVRNEQSTIVKIKGPPLIVQAGASEVRRRVASMADPPDSGARHGTCSACGDTMLAYVGGWCELCCLARRVALRDRIAAETLLPVAL
jgi:hypothetical protein